MNKKLNKQIVTNHAQKKSAYNIFKVNDPG